MVCFQAPQTGSFWDQGKDWVNFFMELFKSKAIKHLIPKRIYWLTRDTTSGWEISEEILIPEHT